LTITPTDPTTVKPIGKGGDRKDDNSYRCRPFEGSSGLVEKDVPASTFQCSNRFAYKVTSYIAVNDPGTDQYQELGQVVARLYNDKYGNIDQSVSRWKSIQRRHFKCPNNNDQVDVAVAFPLVFRHLKCNADSWRFGVYAGAAAESNPDTRRRSQAGLTYYSAFIERLRPEIYNASAYFSSAIGSIGSDGDMYAGQTQAGYLTWTGPGVDIFVNDAVRVEFFLTLTGYSSNTADSSPVARLEFYDRRKGQTTFSRNVVRRELPLNTRTAIKLVGLHENFNAIIDLRVYKYTGFALKFNQVIVCVETDGSTCSQQIDDSCVVPAPTPPPSIPPYVCAKAADSCETTPCCVGFMCQGQPTPYECGPRECNYRKLCVPRPPIDLECCGRNPCIPSESYHPNEASKAISNKHYFGKKGRSFDGKQRDRDDSWSVFPEDGRGFHFDSKVRVTDYGI